MTYTYDQEAWEAVITIRGVRYTYSQVSPFHWRQFLKRVKRNMGKAMAYLRGFKFTKEA